MKQIRMIQLKVKFVIKEIEKFEIKSSLEIKDSKKKTKLNFIN